MKTGLLILCCVFASAAFAQVTDKEVLKKKLEEFNKKYPGVLPSKPSPFASQPYQPIPKNFTGVYALPLDGTPCVVPDTKAIAAMPNLYPNPSVPFRAGRMPNRSPVKPVIPQSNGKNK